MDISIGKLQQLVTVARTGSFSKAALELNISQPALSRSIAAIEARYGFQIFNRTGHGVQLTAAGAQVIEQAQPLLQSLRVFDNNLRLIGSGEAGTLTLGLAPLLASQVLADFSGEFFASGGRVQLRTTIGAGAILVEGLKNDTIELFLCPEGYIDPDPEIETTAVGVIDPVCVVRREHPLAQRRDLELADLSEYPWASSVAPPFIEVQELRPAQLVCDNYHILRDTVLRSDLICICSPSFVASQLTEGSLREIRVKGLPLRPTAILAARLRGRIESPLAREAIRRLRAHLRPAEGVSPVPTR